MSRQLNRGKEAKDDLLFSGNQQAKIMEALNDLSFLLTRGYGERSALALVGNRYRLNVRQQKALRGMAASQEQVVKRNSSRLNLADLSGKSIFVDGFNQIILLESLLSGAWLFQGLDGYYRDLSGIHGTYKRVSQTEEALQLILEFFKESQLASMHWYFDQPVSNSGRMKKMIDDVAEKYQVNWTAELVYNPDQSLIQSGEIILSSDAYVLDHAKYHVNLIQWSLDREEVISSSLFLKP